MNYKPETHQEILELSAGLNDAGKDKKNAKFNLVIAQGKYTLKKHVSTIEEAAEPSEEYLDFDKRKRELHAKYATAASNGQTKIPDDKWPEFKAELDEFRAAPENKEIEDAFDAQEKSYKKLLKSQPTGEDEKPLVIKMVEIPKSMIPDTLSGNQIAAIMPIVKI